MYLTPTVAMTFGISSSMSPVSDVSDTLDALIGHPRMSLSHLVRSILLEQSAVYLRLDASSDVRQLVAPQQHSLPANNFLTYSALTFLITPPTSAIS